MVKLCSELSVSRIINIAPKKIFSIVAIFVIGLSSAEGDLYINADVGYANIQNWWTAAPALTLNVGYNYNKYLASEVGATWINSISTTYDGAGYGGSYTQGQSFADIAAKGSLPFSDIFSVYAKAGLGVAYSTSSMAMQSGVTNYDWNGDSSGIAFGLYMALGAELKLSQHWGMTFEDYGMMPFTGNNWGNINVFGIGGKYNF